MKFLLFGCFILSGSFCLALPWDKTVLTEYGKASSYKELFCTTLSRPQACKQFEKAMGRSFEKRPLKVSLENGDALVVHGAAVQVRVVRKNETTYLINQREINLVDVRSYADLRKAVQKALPRKSVSRQSLWISTAWASDAGLPTTQVPRKAQQTAPQKSLPNYTGLSNTVSAFAPEPGEVDLEIEAGLDFLIIRSQNLTNCQEISAFVRACEDQNVAPAFALGQSEKAYKRADIETKKRQMDVAKKYIDRMKLLNSQLRKTNQPPFSTLVKECSRTNSELQKKFSGCATDFRAYTLTLETMNNYMGNQLINESEAMKSIEDDINASIAAEDEDPEHDAEEMQYAPAPKSSKAKGGTQ